MADEPRGPIPAAPRGAGVGAPARSARRHRVLGAWLALILAGVAWWARWPLDRPQRPTTERVPPARPAVVTAGGAGVAAPVRQALAGGEAPHAASAGATPSGAVGGDAASPATLWRIEPDRPGPRRRLSLDLCGPGTVVVDLPAAGTGDGASPGGAAQARAEVADEAILAQLDAAWPRLLRHLVEAPAPRARAAGWLLAIGAPAGAIAGQDPAAALLGLVQLARGAGDAWVLQQAVQQCAGAETLPVCAGLSPRLWLQVDRSNALAWLALWAREPAARDEVLHGLAMSRRADSGFGQLSWQLAEYWPADLPTYLLPAAVLRAGVFEAARLEPDWRPLLAACGAATVQADANRRAVCEATAQLLALSGRDLMTRAMGLSLGDRLGWTPLRRQGWLALRQAAQEGALSEGPPSAHDAYACASVDRLRSRLRSLAELGEADHWLAWQRARR